MMRNLFAIACCLWALLIGEEATAGTILPDDTASQAKLRELLLERQPDNNGYVTVGDMMFRRPKDLGTLGAIVSNTWTSGRLVYEFEPNISNERRLAFAQACAAWTVNTPISCAERQGEPDFIFVETHFGGDTNKCGGFRTSCSPIGMMTGRQPMFIFDGQWSDQRTLIHEIGHALGLIHEHSREDRDKYIFINYNNMIAGAASQFTHMSAKTLTTYDYVSIMHYPNCAFSSQVCDITKPDVQTITPKACHLDIVGGNAVSELDRDAVRKSYAAGLIAMLESNARQSCGVYELNPDQVLGSCGANCPEATPAEFRKREALKHKWCAFAPVVYPEMMCKPINKTYIEHTWDYGKCGRLNLDTESELVVHCGCPAQSFTATCVNTEKFIQNYHDEGWRKNARWRDNRVAYFHKVIATLQEDGFVTNDVISRMGDFYQKNYLDPRLETKLFKARAGLFSYARWKRSIDKSYYLDWNMFSKIVRHNKLMIAGN